MKVRKSKARVRVLNPTRKADDVLGQVADNLESPNEHEDYHEKNKGLFNEAQKALYEDLMAIVGEDIIMENRISNTRQYDADTGWNNAKAELRTKLREYFGQEEK